MQASDWKIQVYAPHSWVVCACVCTCLCVSQAVEDRGIRAGKVNCDTHQRLCQEAQVNAYPSVRFYSGSSQTRRAQVSTRFTQVSK